MPTLAERIESLQKKLTQEREKKARIEARRKSEESKKARAADTKRKILVGAAVLSKVEAGDWPREKLQALLNTALTRNSERALFDLPPLPAPAPEPAPENAARSDV